MKFSPPKFSGGTGKVPAPKNTVPHLHLAAMFSKLAAMHAQKAMANSPDKAVANLPRPDKAVGDERKNGFLGRQPVIGTPNPAF